MSKTLLLHPGILTDVTRVQISSYTTPAGSVFTMTYSEKAKTENGVTELINKKTISFKNTSEIAALKNIYILVSDVVYYVPESAAYSYSVSGSTYTAYARNVQKVQDVEIRLSSGVGHSDAIQHRKITYSSNNGDDLSLGSVCSSCLEVKIFSRNADLCIPDGTEFTVYSVAPDGVESQIGVYTATESEWVSKHVYKVKAFDNVRKLDRDITAWLRGLAEWPYAITDFFGMLCTECGVGYCPIGDGSATWSGASSFMVHKFDLKDGTTGRQLMGTICEVMGDYCIALPDGRLTANWYRTDYIKLYPTKSQLTGDDPEEQYYFQGSLSYGDFDVQDVKYIQFREEQSEDAALWPDYSDDAEADLSNVYIITGNPILLSHPTYLTDSTVTNSVRNVLTKIADRFDYTTYRPFKVVIPELLEARVGEYVWIYDAQKLVVIAPITALTWNGHKMTLECTAKRTRAQADSFEHMSNTQLAQYSDRVISRTPQEQLFEKLAGSTPGLLLSDGKISTDASFAHNGQTVSVAGHYYNGSSDTTETAFETWLSNQHASMADMSVRDVAFRCKAAGSSDVFYGRLCCHNANYAVLYGFNYGGLMLLKRLYSGTWQASKTQTIGG